ncbi:MAG: pantetheine-phosphate adenylyltransferase [Deltaproteobacteria bacterium]|nr:MAG: pantetheine-phosphate adenylyltransferase [Deltaproteobacteria bacterium]
MKHAAIYPGTFDPPTNGHLDIVERSSKVFDRVIVAVAFNPHKTPLFPVEKRVELLKEITSHLENVEVTSFTGLLVDYAKQVGARVIVRGLRAVSDFEYEFQMAHMNKKLYPELDTVFMMTGEKYFYVSSNIVKEIASFGGDVSELVHPLVEEELKKVFSK